MMPLVAISLLQALVALFFLLAAVGFALYVGCGWYKMGRKRPGHLKRVWSQKERDELETLRHINEKEKHEPWR